MAGERISEIVGAVKSYTYLDQAPVQRIDVRKGLDDTLVILRSKLRAGVDVTRHYAPNLPEIEAYGSELNQVWTNLVDNAADAMDGRGAIDIYADPIDEGGVQVRICDTGPGIPADVLPRLFEPFFTTKAPGVGTGLGLHITPLGRRRATAAGSRSSRRPARAPASSSRCRPRWPRPRRASGAAEHGAGRDSADVTSPRSR